MKYIGIDIGKSGGIAVIENEMQAFAMPATERDLYDLLKPLQNLDETF